MRQNLLLVILRVLSSIQHNSQNIHGDKLNTLVAFAILAAQHGMHWVNLGLYPGWNTSTGSAEYLNRLGSFLWAMAQSNGDEGLDIAPPQSDLHTAEELGRRVAVVTKQWVKGHRAAAEESSQQKQEVGTATAL